MDIVSNGHWYGNIGCSHRVVSNWSVGLRCTGGPCIWWLVLTAEIGLLNAELSIADSSNNDKNANWY